MRKITPPALVGFQMIDSGKNPENYCWEVEWVNENEPERPHANKETFHRRSSALQALTRLAETDGIIFLSIARRFS